MDDVVETSTTQAWSQSAEGAAAVAGSSHQVRERRRVKELLRYLHPFKAQVGSEGKPRISTDTALTALVQLATLKLNCQRGFISLIDNANQYIVAEATQTVSLTSEDVYDKENDELSFGQTVVDAKTGVCPGTIACFTSPESVQITSTYITATRTHYVINDMSMVEGYAQRSYVRGWPHMRYYAEVPIHSPSGTCIGTLCVVDNKARNGLDLRGVRILGEISNTVMDHLELCVNKIQQDRAERMIQGLGHFAEGNFGAQESLMDVRAAAPGLRQLGVEGTSDIELGSELEDLNIGQPDNLWDNAQPTQNLHPEIPYLPAISHEAGSDGRSELFRDESTFSSTAAQKSANINDTAQTSFASTGYRKGSHVTDSAMPPKATEDKMSVSEDRRSIDISSVTSNSIDGVLFRAAKLIREATDLDGVVFFDPRSTMDGRLLTDFTHNDGDMSRPAPNHDTQQNRTTSNVPLESQPAFSKVMSFSTQAGMEDDDDDIKVPESTLRNLLKQFPRGGLLTFDDEGIVGAESLTSLIGGSQSKDRRDVFPMATRRDSFAVNALGLPEAELRRSFPGVTSMMIYSFWDNIRVKCVAHCIAWTSEPARIFQRQEFTYIASFSNSVIAELSRIEAIAADKAKSTFISSISHELRSPLHGIMASMEILRDLTSDASFQDLFGTIESCGSTLLDTIDNVLAFSQTSRQNAKEDGKLLSKKYQSADGPESAVDMELLVEEVTSLCLTGVQFRTIVDSSTPHRSEQLRRGAGNASKWDDVIAICDIGPGDWTFKTNRAVWKRILLNLVGNALKYTSSGSIVVTLRQETALEDPSHAAVLSDTQQSLPMEQNTGSPILKKGNLETEPTVKRIVHLTVKDSGKGMSQDYLANYLFQPFYQENPLAPGTGLGLSIVERLVRSIGGKTNVTSKEGVGTEFTVEVPLSPPEGHIEISPAELSQSPTARLGVIGLNPSNQISETRSGIPASKSKALSALASAVDSYAATCNLVATAVDSIDSNDADILFCQDSHYQLLDSSQVLATGKPVIVLVEPLRTHEHTFEKPLNVVLLSNPFGPRKFQQIIDVCLRVRHSLLDTSPVAAVSDVKDYPLAQRSGLVSRTQTPTPATSDVENTEVKEVRPAILLVEDNPINLKLLVASVSRMGHPFLTATNGVEAVDAYRASSMPILLIFMDVQMPTMDGIQASREIRIYEKQNELPRSVIVALTALDSAEAKQAASDSGVDLFFTKPVSVKKLKEIVTQHYN